MDIMDSSDYQLFLKLVEVWGAKRPRNVLRTVYHDGKQAFEDFRISIPPQLTSFAPTLGWIEKGVDALTSRVVFEGFVTPDDEDYGLDELAWDNSLDDELPLAFTSSAMHSCAFLTVSHGGPGEPDVLIIPRAADEVGALWNMRRRRLEGLLAVTSWDKGAPDGLAMYTRDRVYNLNLSRSGKWVADWVPNPVGEVLAARLPYKPNLKRPFGRSRITRAAMSINDSALRTILRSEVSAEFYSSPQRYVLGANVEAFEGKDAKWKAIMGRVLALERDPETDELPSVGQFAATSPQPHAEQLRSQAMLFAGEMNMSPASLGVIHDNPASADAMYASKEDLINDARGAGRSWGRGARWAMQLAYMLGNNTDKLPDGLMRLSAQFSDPATVSPAGQADAFVKRSQVIPGFAESEVGLETAGLTREQIIRFKAETKRAGAQSLLAALANRPEPSAPSEPAEPAERVGAEDAV